MTAIAHAPAVHEPPAIPNIKVTAAGIVRSEWIKLRSLRSTWVTYGIGLLGMIGIGALVANLTNARWSEMRPVEIAMFDPVARSFAGVYLAQLVIGVIGVLVISGEYATGTIRATFGAVPKRLPVLAAKVGVFAVTTFVLSLLAAFGSFLLGQRLLATHGVALSAPGALRSVVGVALYLTVVGVLGLALGFTLRSTAGGIAALVGLLLVLPAIGRLLPSSWQENVLPYLPGDAGAALFQVNPDPGTLAPWTGFAVMCAWTAAAVAVAVVLLRRRDA
jgi:ABC-2 type transport system permease protein